MTKMTAARARCLERAQDLETEADFIDLELKALLAVEAAEYARYDNDKSSAGMFRVRHFMDRRDDAKRRMTMTLADVTHYREVAAHLATQIEGADDE